MLQYLKFIIAVCTILKRDKYTLKQLVLVLKQKGYEYQPKDLEQELNHLAFRLNIPIITEPPKYRWNGKKYLIKAKYDPLKTLWNAATDILNLPKYQKS